MPHIALPEGVSIHCAIDDYLWPWDDGTPVLMMHGFAGNASLWNRWVPAIAGTHRVTGPIFSAAAFRTSRRRPIATRRRRSARRSSRCSTRCHCRVCIGSASPGRSDRAATRRGTPGPNCKPGAVQHALAHPGSDQAHLRTLSCSPFQAAGTENLCLFVQAVQHGRHWAKQEARS